MQKNQRINAVFTPLHNIKKIRCRRRIAKKTGLNPAFFAGDPYGGFRFCSKKMQAFSEAYYQSAKSL